MQGKWIKKGLVLRPDINSSWMKTHAMLPTPMHMEGSLYRIYFAGRNEKNQSHVGYAVIDINEPEKILEVSRDPVLKPGRLGTFDDNGVLPSCLIKREDGIYMYYIGFKPGGTTRMDLFGGLAISQDGGETFERWSEAPIIERNRVNPFINTAPWVVKDDSDEWLMYYVAGIEWVHADLPRYNIQIARSGGGKVWERDGRIAINFAKGENALARPYVVRDENGWHMWFSAKGNYYLPYTAHSNDGIRWERGNNPVLACDINGPDQEMICYPVVLQNGDKKIMYYNGNAYGRDGLCLAVFE